MKTPLEKATTVIEHFTFTDSVKTGYQKVSAVIVAAWSFAVILAITFWVVAIALLVTLTSIAWAKDKKPAPVYDHADVSKAQQFLQTPAVHAQMNDLYKNAQHTFFPQPHVGPNAAPHEEYSFTVNKDGSVTPVVSSHTNDKNAVTVTPGETQAIVHTHPLGTYPSPGDGDVPAAEAAGCPNYVLSVDELWVANPDGTKSMLADVSFKHGNLEFKWKS